MPLRFVSPPYQRGKIIDVRERKEELFLLHANHLVNLTRIPTKYYQNISEDIEAMGTQEIFLKFNEEKVQELINYKGHNGKKQVCHCTRYASWTLFTIVLNTFF